MEVERIRPWEQCCVGFEYGNRDNPACLEKIVSLLRGREKGAVFPNVNFFEELYSVDGGFVVVYQLPRDVHSSLDDGGHHRVLTGRIGKYEVASNVFGDAEELMRVGKRVDRVEGRVDFSEMYIASRPEDFKWLLSDESPYEVPEGLLSPSWVPSDKEVRDFFVANEKGRVTSDLILKELYGVY